jgi:hypothetical protein
LSQPGDGDTRGIRRPVARPARDGAEPRRRGLDSASVPSHYDTRKVPILEKPSFLPNQLVLLDCNLSGVALPQITHRGRTTR